MEYYSRPEISCSDLKVYVNKGIETYKAHKQGLLPKVESKAFEFGTLIHMVLLQPELIESTYCVLKGKMPILNKNRDGYIQCRLAGESVIDSYMANYATGNTFKNDIYVKAEALEKELENYIEFLVTTNNRIPISTTDWETMWSIKESFESYKKLNTEFIFNFPLEAEQELYGNIYELRLRSKLDAIFRTEYAFADIKTTENGHRTQFEEVIQKYGYDLQIGFYNYMCTINSIYVNRCVLVSVDKVFPYTIREYVFMDDTLLKCTDKFSKYILDLSFDLDRNETRNLIIL